jgi:hypothetical protein
VHGAAYAHLLLLDKLEVIIGPVENAGKKDAKGYKKKRAAKTARGGPQGCVRRYPERSDAGNFLEYGWQDSV